MADNWVHAIPISEFPESGLTECVVDGKVVAICRTADGYHAMDGICPHQGGSLGKGSIHGCIARCPWHGWEYDVRDGQHQSIPAVTVPIFQVRVSGDSLEVNLP